MKQVIVLETSDLQRLKDGETIQLTGSMLLSLEQKPTRAPRGPYKKTQEEPETPTPEPFPHKRRGPRAPMQTITPGRDGKYHCEQCHEIYQSPAALRGHLGAHAKYKQKMKGAA